jgi:hypothetical protein
MSVKQIGLCILVASVCGLGKLHAQAPVQAPDVLPLYSPSGSGAASPYNSVSSGSGINESAMPSFVKAPAGTNSEGVALDEGSPPIPPVVPIPLGLPASPYLTYPRAPCCCGNVGKCGGPIDTEIFFRSGAAFPIGGGTFNQYLHPGWDIEAGGRLLLFNPTSTAAWTATMSVSNIYAASSSNTPPVLLYRVPVFTAPPGPPTGFPILETVVLPNKELTVQSLNMTFVNLGMGREWWLLGSANPGQQQGWNWRVGIDGGGRYGSAMVRFDEIQHHTGVVGGMYAAIDSDLEHPIRCGIFFVGVRFEYNYIWTSLLQDQNNGDFQSLNLLLQTGVRF